MKQIALTFLTIFLLSAACSSKKQEGDKRENQISNGSYICPMDKDISSDKPGTCPKCGMDLVKK